MAAESSLFHSQNVLPHMSTLFMQRETAPKQHETQELQIQLSISVCTSAKCILLTNKHCGK
jgi:hypothetical protein